mmetsp:Transcript_19730/g.41456  ORF Transcript_19730/g.41456 Transcript_19730/m.41456 type:complete len:312 (+) Transcript_19730:122-1057(+)
MTLTQIRIPPNPTPRPVQIHPVGAVPRVCRIYHFHRHAGCQGSVAIPTVQMRVRIDTGIAVSMGLPAPSTRRPTVGSHAPRTHGRFAIVGPFHDTGTVVSTSSSSANVHAPTIVPSANPQDSKVLPRNSNGFDIDSQIDEVRDFGGCAGVSSQDGSREESSWGRCRVVVGIGIGRVEIGIWTGGGGSTDGSNCGIVLVQFIVGMMRMAMGWKDDGFGTSHCRGASHAVVVGYSHQSDRFYYVGVIAVAVLLGVGVVRCIDIGAVGYRNGGRWTILDIIRMGWFDRSRVGCELCIGQMSVFGGWLQWRCNDR